MSVEDLREYVDSRLTGLETDRQSWWLHWSQLAEYILPRRFNWLVTVGNMNRGLPINQHIIDSTGTIAFRTLAAGLMSGVTSPTRPWFKLRIEGFDSDESHPVSIWLADCEKRMLKVFAESNFYTSMATVFQDLSVFGTAVMIIHEDYNDIIRCYNPCAGEYYLANSDREAVNTMYRKFSQSAGQLAEWFGEEKLSESAKSALRTGAGKAQNFVVCHAIEPNTDGKSSVARSFPFREVYWEWGQRKELVLRERGLFEWPALCPRWDLAANDAYGRSPAMDALGDIKQLQQEQKRKAQAIDKMVNPPMVADVQLRNQPATLIPGGITYVAGKDNTGFKPAYQISNFSINEIMQDIQEVQTRIQRIAFNDLFMMFQQLEAEPRSAAAIDARREEKLVMLGPVLERFENEALDPAIDRTFNIMRRARLLLPPPAEIQGAPVQIQYISMLAEAQRAVGAAGIERTFAMAGNMAAVDPTIMDNLDLDEGIREYATMMALSPKLMRDLDAVTARREQRQKQEQAIQQMQMTDAAVNAGKTLSETDVGGGQNALGALLGNTVQ